MLVAIFCLLMNMSLNSSLSVYISLYSCSSTGFSGMTKLLRELRYELWNWNEIECLEDYFNLDCSISLGSHELFIDGVFSDTLYLFSVFRLRMDSLSSDLIPDVICEFGLFGSLKVAGAWWKELLF